MHRIGYPNSFEFNPAKPFTIPYGEYPHAKGVVQVVNATSAAAFAMNIQTAQAEGAPGLPIYAGHPDVPELAVKYPDKAAKGWLISCKVGDDSCVLSVEWVKEPEPGEFIYFSPYFFSNPPESGKAVIDEIKSIGLTNDPNSTRFRLPNEAATTNQKQKGEPAMDNLILEALGLPEDASVEQAVAKINEIKGTANEEAEDLKKEVEDAKTEADKAKEEFANERTARLGLMLDNALAAGQITPATRPVWEKRLRKDFANEASALARVKPAVKKKSAFANAGADRDGFANEADILTRYEAMPKGPEKSEFLQKHARQINDARVARAD